MGSFPDAQWQLTPQSLGPIWPNFELVRDVMDVLVTFQYEENPIKKEALECAQQYTSIFQIHKGR